MAANDPQQLETVTPHLKTFLSWLSAVLGIGTVAGFVNILVGVLSASWLAYQLWVAITYELPVKRARHASRMAAARSGRRDPDPSDQAPLT